MVYALIMLQIAAGVTVIACSINSSRSIDAYSGYIRSQTEAFPFIVTGFAEGEKQFNNPSITTRDYAHLRDALEGKAVVGYEAYARFLEQGDNQYVEITMLFVSPEFTRAYLGQEVAEGQALAGKNVLASTVYQTRSRLNKVTFDRQGFTLSNKKRYAYTPLVSPKLDSFQGDLLSGPNVMFDDAVILSLSEIEYFYDIHPTETDCSLHYSPIDPEDPALLSEIGRTITGHLSAQHEADGTYARFDEARQYTPVDTLLSYYSITDFQSQTLQLYTWISYVCMVIVVLGIMGQLLVHIIRRRSEMAVRQMLGATPMSVFLALLFEIGSVCATGGILGLLAARPATLHWVTSSIVPITYHAETVWIIAVCILLMALVPTAFVLTLKGKEKPAELLKSL